MKWDYKFKQHLIGDMPVGMVELITSNGIMCFLVPKLKKGMVKDYLKLPHVKKQIELFEQGEIGRGDRVEMNVMHDNDCLVPDGKGHCTCKPDYQMLRVIR